MSTITPGRIVRPAELRAALKISQNTIREHVKSGKLPPYDTELSKHVKWWTLATLRKHGIKV